VWPACAPPPSVTEPIEEGIHTIGNELERAWNFVTGNEADDTGETEGEQCPLIHPSASPNFDDPSQPPAPGWEWRGNGPPGSNEGAWYNPETDESLHPDLEHGEPQGQHYDYTSPSGEEYRVYPDGRVEPKS
jgi:hypothetical protein